jgi:hypothetical protein
MSNWEFVWRRDKIGPQNTDKKIFILHPIKKARSSLTQMLTVLNMEKQATLSMDNWSGISLLLSNGMIKRKDPIGSDLQVSSGSRYAQIKIRRRVKK